MTIDIERRHESVLISFKPDPGPTHLVVLRPEEAADLAQKIRELLAREP